MPKKLLKAGVIVSLMTFLSRVLGLIRDAVVANLMGASSGSDIFFFANKIPNFLRRLFAEGAFAQAFIPVLTEVQANEDKQELKKYIANVSGTLGLIVFLTAIVGVICSPLMVALFGMGWFVEYLQDGKEAEKFLLASTVLKITFPYILFVTLAGFVGAILNTLNQFAVSAFTPVLLNVCIILCGYLLMPYVSIGAFALAWGVFIGGICQLLFQLPFLAKAGLFVMPKWGWKDPYVKKVRKLMIPALFGVSVGQLNLLLDTIIASFLVTGSISWLYYSDRLLEFPLGLFGIAIATVILPTLSRDHVKQDKQSFSLKLDWATRLICSLGIPAAMALIILAMPLLLVIFQRGEFTVDTAYMASLSLMAYGTGLLGFMLVKIYAPAFYSRQDTKTPVKYGIITMIANMIFNFILAWPFGYIGLAIATSISGILNAFLLYRKLGKDGVFKVSYETKKFIIKVFLAAAVMSISIFYFSTLQTWQTDEFWLRVQNLTFTIIIGLISYVATLFILRVKPKDFVSN